MIFFARIAPAILTGIPLYVLYYFLVSPPFNSFLQSLFALKVASDVTVALAILYLAMQLNRFNSKELFEKSNFQNG